jgi:hydroxyethylthiazole kinase-like uncharacterized protein yjeF
MGNSSKDTVTSIDMRKLELNSEALGVSAFTLMENAGRSVVDEVERRFKGDVTILTGSGGKAGDGYVAARHFAARGHSVLLKWVHDPADNSNAAARLHWDGVKRLNTIRIEKYQDEPSIDTEIVIDALLGTGFRPPLHEPYKSVISKVNSLTGSRVVSIDLPSGLDPDSPELADTYVKADLVVALHRKKRCLLSLSGTEVVVASIGIPPEAHIFAGPGDVLVSLPKRSQLMKKGDAGKLTVVAGSSEYVGAAILSVMGGFRSGVDLVYLIAPQMVVDSARNMIPELISIPYEGDALNKAAVEKFKKILPKTKAVAIGPGLGFYQESSDAFSAILGESIKHRIPGVIDADGLRYLSQREIDLGHGFVLTPHAGEFSYFGEKPADDLGKRIEQVAALARKMKSTIHLKGNCDVVSDGTLTRLSMSGHPAMAVAGTGDVLTGLVGGFISKGVQPFTAALCGVYALGLAGHLAFKEKGERLIARDIVEYIPKALLEPVKIAHDYVDRRLPDEIVSNMRLARLLW